MNTREPVRLDTLGVLLVSGPDARNFLQGQLTADLHTLTPNNVLLAACNSPQGRVQAVLWTIQRADDIALIVHTAMLQSTLTRLRRYVLRAKVAIDTEQLHVGVIPQSDLEPSATSAPHVQVNELSYVRLASQDQALVIAPRSTQFGDDALAAATWHAQHLRAGLPTIYPQTHEAFVAQMLNLDLLDGISFEKGCYTGQEIIARTHYRGAIKRRMFRMRGACEPPLPGIRLLAGDQHAGDVVDAIPSEGGCELLAVISLGQLGSSIELETQRGAPLERLPLPYEIPVE